MKLRELYTLLTHKKNRFKTRTHFSFDNEDIDVATVLLLQHHSHVLTNLSFNNCTFSERALRLLSKLLIYKFRHLREFTFTNHAGLSLFTWLPLLRAIQWSKLHSVNLSNNNIRFDESTLLHTALCSLIIKNKHLIALNLSGNYVNTIFNRNGCAVLINALARNTTLRSLDLSNTTILPADANSLLQHASRLHLNHLGLNNNRLQHLEVLVSHALQKGSSITSLDVSNNLKLWTRPLAVLAKEVQSKQLLHGIQLNLSNCAEESGKPVLDKIQHNAALALPIAVVDAFQTSFERANEKHAFQTSSAPLTSVILRYCGYHVTPKQEKQLTATTQKRISRFFQKGDRRVRKEEHCSNSHSRPRRLNAS